VFLGRRTRHDPEVHHGAECQQPYSDDDRIDAVIAVDSSLDTCLVLLLFST
jgi:hypothetical protein